eukprot:5376631-Prymnesium_polylepis.1
MSATAASTAFQQRSMRNLSRSADSPSLAGTPDVDAQRNHRACCSMKAASAVRKLAHASCVR